jgi:cytochrome c biogenesis protein CcdA
MKIKDRLKNMRQKIRNKLEKAAQKFNEKPTPQKALLAGFLLGVMGGGLVYLGFKANHMPSPPDIPVQPELIPVNRRRAFYLFDTRRELLIWTAFSASIVGYYGSFVLGVFFGFIAWHGYHFGRRLK